MERSSYEVGQPSQSRGTPSGLDAAVFELQEYLSDNRPPLLVGEALSTLLRTEPPIVISMGRIAEVLENWAAGRAEALDRTVAEGMSDALMRIAQAHESGSINDFVPARFFPKILELLRARCPLSERSIFDNRVSQLKLHFDWGFDDQPEAVAHMVVEMEGRALGGSVDSEFNKIADELLDSRLQASDGLFRRTLTQLRTKLITERELSVTQALDRLVENAISLFNSGDEERSELVFRLVREGLTLPRLGDDMRQAVRSSHESSELDQTRFTYLVESERSKSFVKAVLSHFSDLQPEALLKSLRFEKDGHRRRLLLSLIRLHGPDVFSLVVEDLQNADKQRFSWYYMRNLIFLLGKVPPPGDFEHYAAINTVGSHLTNKNPQLRHAALTTLNLLGGQSALDFMIEALDEKRYRPTDLQDPRTGRHVQNIIEFIARYPGEASHQVLAEIACALRCQGFHDAQKLRSITFRELQKMSQHLSAPASNYLVAQLRQELKNSGIGIGGFAIGVSTDECLNLLSALAGLRTAEAVMVIREVAQRYSRHIIGKRATEILARIGKSPES